MLSASLRYTHPHSFSPQVLQAHIQGFTCVWDNHFALELNVMRHNFYLLLIPSTPQEMIVPNSVIDLPPPSPPKAKTIVLPPGWKVARDPEGKIYYYHIITRSAWS